MPIESILLDIVFTMFGLEVLLRAGSWWFGQWRSFQDMKDAAEVDAEAGPSKVD